MQNVRRCVEGSADAMAAEIAHHAEALAFDVGLDGVADIAQRGTGPHRLHAAHHGVVSHLHEHARLGGRSAGDIHAARVAVPPVENDGYIYIKHVAVEQPAIAGNAVADDVVDRNAGRLREAAIIQRRRNSAMADDEIMANPVELAGSDTGPDMRRNHV